MRWYPPQEERGTRTKTVTSPHLQHTRRGRRRSAARFGVPPGKHGHLGGTATGSTRDPRRAGEGCGGVLLALPGRLPPCAGEVGRSAGNNSPMVLRQNDSQAHGSIGGRGTHTCERRGNALLAAPEEAGDPASSGETARRNCAAGGAWRMAPATRTPPPRQPGATDGNQGESTGTGVVAPGSANAREATRPRTGNGGYGSPRGSGDVKVVFAAGDRRC